MTFPIFIPEEVHTELDGERGTKEEGAEQVSEPEVGLDDPGIELYLGVLGLDGHFLPEKEHHVSRCL